MDIAKAVALEWVAAWNGKNLEAVLSHYEPDVVFESLRVASAYASTNGEVGSPDGILHGVAALRPYFKQAIDNLPNLKLEYMQLLEGPPGGWYALQYRRETGAVVLETFQIKTNHGSPVDGASQTHGSRSAEAAVSETAALQTAVDVEGDTDTSVAAHGTAAQPRPRISAVRVFYEAVC